ncbi:DUF3581 domain-containing protein [Neiella marina]|uniref:DUF3581 domain-containing protein n=1 Tax=Neiella holothuriorum TaxID=2870530 RepID=A0ABS7ECW0_9GAMM|nr:DUF3581 domain-containing protein [Neiella holothuriorum]MBW8189562.1 DUF3581 domain-containing protein [Neiella holothuriorum]
MVLETFYQCQQGTVTITAEQASRFAKRVAGDFNPIHDADAKRFCVPGDLLFAVVLKEYGIQQTMDFKFEGMLSADRTISLPDASLNQFSIQDVESDKTYLQVSRAGANRAYDDSVEALIRNYVSFSGQNFPYILVPLMERHDVMINPARPLVMYESMSLTLETLDFEQPELSLASTELDVNGKRGDAYLNFEIHDQGKLIGQGRKKMVLSGLRPFCSEQMAAMEQAYLERKENVGAA